LLMAVLLALLLGGLYGFRMMRDTIIKGIFSAKPPPVSVATAVARSETVPRFLSGIGTLAAVHQVTISAQLGGMVTQILFTPGAAVKAGDPLVQLDDGPEKADLRNFEAQARYAEISLRRANLLMQKQAGPQATVDQTQSLLDQANAGIAKTKAQIAQKLVRAPFSGKLGVRQVELGQYVAAGAAMVSLTDLTQLYVNFTLPEQAAAALTPKQAVELGVDAYPEQRFQAVVDTVEPQLSADTRTIKVQAIMDNPDGKLLPGMFANVRLMLPARENQVTVPETAVENTLYGDSVYLVRSDAPDKDGKSPVKAVRVPVKAGEHFAGRVAIAGDIKPGDQIVALGQVKLYDGAQIVPHDTGGLTAPAAIPNH
jgi:membrane fusion protein, multidrug efflux system